MATQHPEPEKLAESMFRSREHALNLKDNRHHTILVPFQAETRNVVQKNVKPAGAKCSAKTLSGKPCSYKALFCGYCSKHLPSDEILKLVRK
jgi:hypothetical protein